MTSTMTPAEIIKSANAKLGMAQKRAKNALESAVNSLWELYAITCDVDDELTKVIKSAIAERTASGGKTFISGFIQKFIRENKSYVPCKEIAPLYESLKIACDAWLAAWRKSEKDFEDVVTLEVLCQYHYEKHQVRLRNNEVIYDDEDTE